jgi:vancomycin permeability regulator SanA
MPPTDPAPEPALPASVDPVDPPASVDPVDPPASVDPVDPPADQPPVSMAPPRRSRLRRWVRRLLLLGLVAGVGCAAVVVASVVYVDRAARGHVFAADAVPAAPVALVLGAQVYEPGDRPSPFLQARLELARRLYVAGTVKVILVSGDNGRPDYNEPGGMVAWLSAHGVPAAKVVPDYAGFDTYDSCARAKLVFGVTRLIVVTQSYHIRRAVSLCRHLGIDADGVGDDSVRDRWVSWWRATTREQGACVKAVGDLTMRRDPVFLGPHEPGVDRALQS